MKKTNKMPSCVGHASNSDPDYDPVGNEPKPTSQSPLSLPTEKQIEAGKRMACELFDSLMFRSLGGDDPEPSAFPDIIQLYKEEKICSVTGIWMAMNRAGGQS